MSPNGVWNVKECSLIGRFVSTGIPEGPDRELFTLTSPSYMYVSATVLLYHIWCVIINFSIENYS